MQGMLRSDSHFEVIKANTEAFTGEDEDEVKEDKMEDQMYDQEEEDQEEEERQEVEGEQAKATKLRTIKRSTTRRRMRDSTTSTKSTARETRMGGTKRLRSLLITPTKAARPTTSRLGR